MKSKVIAKAGLVGVIMSLSLTAQALPTSQVVFAKGSYCGSYTGDLSKGRVFKVSLGANQELVINTDGHVQSVKDSKGRRLTDHGDSDYRYYTRSKGEHRITMVGSGFSSAEFCVY